MNILILAPDYPLYDRSSGDLRLYSILRILAKRHCLFFCRFGKQKLNLDTKLYESNLESLGITLCDHRITPILKSKKFDIVFFEFYYGVSAYVDTVRFWQPQARVVVDSVDVHFNRFFAKARLSGDDSDFAYALDVKYKEMAAYRKADAVIAVTQLDKEILLTEQADLNVEIIPNIHKIPALSHAHQKQENSLIFIGGFRHEPNVDAMLYFSQKVFPIIQSAIPGVVLKVIGDAMPDSVRDALSDSQIEILGYVPDTRPYLEASQVSIAPLRFGGGMKGKIGEAMAFGLPVVTTRIGIEGFGLTPGENVLVGDTPRAFAEHVIRLLQNAALREKIGKAGRTFIRNNYSEEALGLKLHTALKRLKEYPLKKLPLSQKLYKEFNILMDRHVLWRFR